MVAGTFNLREASAMQSGLLGMDWLIMPWNNPFMIPAFILFFVAALAETKRAPFDLPEAESELVAGFLTAHRFTEHVAHRLDRLATLPVDDLVESLLE